MLFTNIIVIFKLFTGILEFLYCQYHILSVFELHQRPRRGGYLRLCQQVPGHDVEGAISPTAAATAAATSVRPPEDVPDGLHGLTEVVQAHLAGGVLLGGRTEVIGFETLPIWVREQRLINDTTSF